MAVAILSGTYAPFAAVPFQIGSGPGYTYDSHAHVTVPTYALG